MVDEGIEDGSLEFKFPDSSLVADYLTMTETNYPVAWDYWWTNVKASGFNIGGYIYNARQMKAFFDTGLVRPVHVETSLDNRWIHIQEWNPFKGEYGDLDNYDFTTQYWTMILHQTIGSIN